MTRKVVLAVAGLLALGLPLPTGAALVLSAVGLTALAYSIARPGSTGPTIVIGAGVLSWLATPAGDLRVARLVAMALAVTVVHSVAALSALVPSGARVPAGLLLRWSLWAAAATAVGVGVLGAASVLPATRTSLTVTALAVVVAGLGGVLVVAVARRDLTSTRSTRS